MFTYSRYLVRRHGRDAIQASQGISKWLPGFAEQLDWPNAVLSVLLAKAPEGRQQLVTVMLKPDQVVAAAWDLFRSPNHSPSDTRLRHIPLDTIQGG